MKVAVVTGAYRGLGVATCQALAQKGFKVILTARKKDKGLAATQKLKEKNLDVEFEELDILSEKSINAFVKRVIEKYKSIDVLVNNAGIFLDQRDADTVLSSFKTNTLGAYMLIEQVLPHMKKNNYGRIVNISSGMGALTDMNGGYPAYRISKTALNSVTAFTADEVKGKNILINSVCPGWVRTEMGGEHAERSIDEGIKGIIWAATLEEGGPSGGFFRDGERIPW